MCLKSNCDYNKCPHAYCNECSNKIELCVICGIKVNTLVVTPKTPDVLPKHPDETPKTPIETIYESFDKILDYESFDTISDIEICMQTIEESSCIIM